MNRLVMIVSLCVCAMAQAVVPAWAVMGQAKVPLLLAGVIYYALTRGAVQAAQAAVLAGVMQDSLGPIPMGYSVLAFLGVALVTNQFRERVFAENAFTHVMIGAAGSLLVSMVLYVLLVSGGHRTGIPFSFVLTKALGMSLLGLGVFPAVFLLIRGLDERLGVSVRGRMG